MSPRAPLSSLLSAAAALLVAGAGSSCAIASNPAGASIGDLPDKQSFLTNDVSDMMEARCAGLDCHGQVGRPLRLYSSHGLRQKAKADGSRDNGPTTDGEKSDNYYAVVGLEPENLSVCFASKGQSFDTLQLLKKPLDIQGQGIRHKGGPVLKASDNDPGWQCLYGWASGSPDKKQCDDGAKIQ